MPILIGWKIKEIFFLLSKLLDILEACNSSVEEFFYYDISAYKKDKTIIELLENERREKRRNHYPS